MAWSSLCLSKVSADDLVSERDILYRSAVSNAECLRAMNRAALIREVRGGLSLLSPRERRELWSEFAKLDGRDGA